MPKKFVPNPTDMVGTLDTSGTAGAGHAKIENVTPVFDIAKAQDLETAARALDPKDTDVPESMVVLPQGSQIVNADPDAARKRVQQAAKATHVADSPEKIQKAVDDAAKASGTKEAQKPEAKEAAAKEAAEKGQQGAPKS